MAGSVQTKAYQHLLDALVKARHASGQSQAELARKIDKPASFVGKYELGERRIDIIELFVILNALNCDPHKFLKSNIRDVPTNL